MAKISIIFLLIFFINLSHASVTLDYSYPDHWWQVIPEDQARSWEILPQAGVKGKSVVLSKRHELGILSNFASTPIKIDGKLYASVEGFWQSLKYPENAQDQRSTFAGIKWKYTRDQVASMVGSKARRAGSLANKNMKKMNINWVTHAGKRISFYVFYKGQHYKLIKRVLREKLKQNPDVLKTLKKTGNLKLMADHKMKFWTPPSFKYHKIYMVLRDE